MEKLDAIAIMLAAEHVAAVRDLADYQKAVSLVESNPSWQGAFEAESAYYREHGDFLATVRLPDHARAQIKAALRRAETAPSRSLIPFPSPWLKLAAAACMVLLAGWLVFRLGSGGDASDLQLFAANTVAERVDLDLEFTSQSIRDVAEYLKEQDAPVGSKVTFYKGLDSLGCKTYPWKGGKVALICFKTAQDQTVHLFIADRSGLDESMLPGDRDRRKLANRATLSWVDALHAYVMVADSKGQKLDGFAG
jgi:hypothetical protein